jgi:hypothetical protein
MSLAGVHDRVGPSKQAHDCAPTAAAARGAGSGGTLDEKNEAVCRCRHRPEGDLPSVVERSETSRFPRGVGIIEVAVDWWVER